MIRKIFNIIPILFFQPVSAQITFPTLDSLFSYAEKTSNVFKVASQQTLLAKWTKITAAADVVNLHNPVTATAIDNVLLPINFIPGEIFGAPAGTFREITLGQQYVTNFNFNPQLDIINTANWARLKSASINKELTDVNNQANAKLLKESIAAAWYNAISAQTQMSISVRSMGAADSVVMVVKNKMEEGIAREQDFNNALINQLLVKDKFQQAEKTFAQQINNLKILCDIPPEQEIKITETLHELNPPQIKSSSALLIKQSSLQADFAKQEWRAARNSMFPVLSFLYYQGWQRNANEDFLEVTKWIQVRYVGLRLSVPIPPDATRISQSYNNKINYRIAALNATHARLQNDLNNHSQDLEFLKLQSTAETANKVYAVKNLNFEKSIRQYQAGILPTDQLLLAFNELLSSALNAAAAQANASYQYSLIVISQKYK